MFLVYAVNGAYTDVVGWGYTGSVLAVLRGSQLDGIILLLVEISLALSGGSRQITLHQSLRHEFTSTPIFLIRARKT